MDLHRLRFLYNLFLHTFTIQQIQNRFHCAFSYDLAVKNSRLTKYFFNNLFPLHFFVATYIIIVTMLFVYRVGVKQVEALPLFVLLFFYAKIYLQSKNM